MFVLIQNIPVSWVILLNMMALFLKTCLQLLDMLLMVIGNTENGGELVKERKRRG